MKVPLRASKKTKAGLPMGQRTSKEGSFAPLGTCGNVWRYVWVSQLGTEVQYSRLEGRSQRSTENPTRHRTVPTMKTDPAQMRTLLRLRTSPHRKNRRNVWEDVKSQRAFG